MTPGSVSKSLNKYDVWSSARMGLLTLLGIFVAQFSTEILAILPLIQEAIANAIVESSSEAAAFLVALLATGFDMARRYIKDYSVNDYNVR